MTTIDSRLPDMLLENWGRWSQGGKPRLGYPTQPMFRYVKTIRKAVESIDETDAMVAEAAIDMIGRREYPRDERPPGYFSMRDFIIRKWAKNYPNQELAHKYKVHRNTITNWVNRAKDEFIAEYLLIVRDAHKVNRVFNVTDRAV